MSLPEPAPRGARPSRRRAALDVRLVIGVLLVVGSVAGVFGIVAAADRRVTVYAAASALTPGQRIERSDLVERTVALDGAEGMYLSGGDIPRDGLVVTQPVARGELLPASAVGSTVGVRSTSIVLQLATRVSGAVVPGASIDLWSAPRVGAGSGPASSSGSGASASDTEAASLAPSVLVSGATVTRVLDATGGFAADTKGSQLEVLVPRSRVARVLQAIADGDALAALPAGIPLAQATDQTSAAGGGS